MSYTLQNITHNYELLSHTNAETRQAANLYLMGLIYDQSAWNITQQMITECTNPNYQFLGAQILHQKIEKEIVSLQKAQLHFLKQFLFSQLAEPSLNLPTIRKITSSAAVIGVVCFLEDWPSMLNDVVQFMKGPAHQLQNGLILLSSLAQELNKSNVIRQGLKIQVKQKIFEQEQLLSQVFLSCMTISSQITTLALEAVENWVGIGFPLIKYKAIINVLILLIEQQQDLFFETCCKVISEAIKITSQLKFQTLATIDLTQEIQKYTSEQIQSIKLIIIYLRNTRPQVFTAIKTLQGIENIQIYTNIVKEMLLSFGFLLLQDVGFQLIEVMMAAFESKSLKLSFSTFQFWLDICQKWSKYKTQPSLQSKLWTIIQYLFSVMLQKIKLQSGNLNELKEEDTIDDLQDVSFAEYRKESRYIIKAAYEFFTKKKSKEGSNAFFSKLIAKIQQKDTNGLGVGTELAIFAVKSSLESMIQQYDTYNLIAFVEYLISKSENAHNIPIKLTAQFLGIITDCNRQIKSKDTLFLKCLAFSLKYVQNQQLCHYSVYAFQSLMQSIESICSVPLINDLLAFYQSKSFTKQIVLEKILDGILTSITKLRDANIISEYFTRIMSAITVRNNEILNSPFEPHTHFLPLIEIKTVLDSFDNFKDNKQYFRNIFLNISNQGIAIVTRIVSSYLANGLKFSNVNELGVSLAVCKNSLKICENIGIQYLPMGSYIGLMNIILSIFTPHDMNYYSTYSSLIEIISKILTQFMNIKVPPIDAWLAHNLIPINNFFLTYSKQKNKFTQNDSDVIKDLFIIQESVLIYSQEIFLSQPQLEQIFNLALLSLQYLNQKQMQRKVVNFIYLCVQMPVFKCKYDSIVRSVFYSIPFVNNICYINLGRIFIVTLQGVDSKKKEQAFRELLEYEPYTDVQRDLKEIFGKFLAFAVDTKQERYIKGVLNDIADAKWKKSGNDLALHLEMRFSSWKREYNKMLKSQK